MPHVIWPSIPYNPHGWAQHTASITQAVTFISSGKHHDVPSRKAQFLHLKYMTFQSWHCSTNILHDKAKGQCEREKQFSPTQRKSPFSLIKLLISKAINKKQVKDLKSWGEEWEFGPSSAPCWPWNQAVIKLSLSFMISLRGQLGEFLSKIMCVEI